jgi:hypothetical protein
MAVVAVCLLLLAPHIPHPETRHDTGVIEATTR